MSSAANAPLQPTPQGPSPDQTRKLIYNTTLGLTILVPLVAALPPRKLDLYTLGLGVTWFFCASHVVEERTGKSLMWHVGSWVPSSSNRELSRRAKDGNEDGDKPMGAVKKLWMGGASDDWVQERAKREKEVLEEEGRGYGGLIMDQIREVWRGSPFKKEGQEEEASSGKKEND